MCTILTPQLNTFADEKMHCNLNRELMNPADSKLILPYTKKYGPLGEITFLLKPLDSFKIPANAVLLEENSFTNLFWVDNGVNQGTVYGNFNNVPFLVMHISYNFPSPNLLMELGFKELFD